MRTITAEMVKQFNLRKLKYDFMGYSFNRVEDLSFHHLIVPKRDCKDQGLGDGYLFWNGAILRQNTSHDYLHVIERVDRETFEAITRCMIEENRNGKLDIENLKRIRNLLLKFEAIHKQDTNGKGQKLIKRKFLTERIDL